MLRVPSLRQRVGWGQRQRAFALDVPLISRSKAAGDPGYINLLLLLCLILSSVTCPWCPWAS